ncbi:hypothetical protein AVEN_11103-1, partial [Araneus ventricosus]
TCIILPCLSIQEQLNDSRSNTEAGAYHQAMAQPFPKEVRTTTGGGTQSPTATIPQTKRVLAYLSCGHSSVYSRCPGDSHYF